MNKIFSLPPKIQQETDIILPPNFEMYSKNTEKVEELQLNLPPRLCENNPLIFPSLPSTPISFENSEMNRLNLENLLNPHQNDIEFMEKELKEYRQQVKNQNEEFKQLEKQRNDIKSFAPLDQSGNLDIYRQQNEQKQAELARIQAEKDHLLNALRMKQSSQQEIKSNLVTYPQNQTRVNQAPYTQQEVRVQATPYDNFFDKREVIRDNTPESHPQQPPLYYMNQMPNNSQFTQQSPARPSNSVFVNQIPPQNNQTPQGYLNPPQYANQNPQYITQNQTQRNYY